MSADTCATGHAIFRADLLAVLNVIHSNEKPKTRETSLVLHVDKFSRASPIAFFDPSSLCRDSLEVQSQTIGVEPGASCLYLLKGVINRFRLILGLFRRRPSLLLRVLMLMLSAETDYGVVGDRVHVVAEPEEADLRERAERIGKGKEGCDRGNRRKD